MATPTAASQVGLAVREVVGGGDSVRLVKESPELRVFSADRETALARLRGAELADEVTITAVAIMGRVGIERSAARR
jgi:hypothetical protein